MKIPTRFVFDDGFHQLPEEERVRLISKEVPEFSKSSKETQIQVVRNAEAANRGRHASSMSTAPPPPPPGSESMLEGAGKDLTLGFRSGVSDLSRTVGGAAGLVGLTGFAEKARQFAGQVAPTAAEQSAREGIVSQLIQGVGAAPAQIIKYAPAEASGPYAPLVAGAIGAVSKADEGGIAMLKEGAKDALMFGGMKLASKAPTRLRRAAGAAAVGGGVAAVASGGNIKDIAANAIMAGGFGAIGNSGKRKNEPLLTASEAKKMLDKGAAGVESRLDFVRRYVAPQNRSGDAAMTSRSIRRYASEVSQSSDIVDYSLRQAEQDFMHLKDPERLQFIADIEHPSRKTTDPKLQAHLGKMREILDAKRDELIVEATVPHIVTEASTRRDIMGRIIKGDIEPKVMSGVVDALRDPQSALESYYLNFFPHLFKNPDRARDAVRGFYAGKRPLPGPRTFFHERSHPTFADALSAVDENGKTYLEPATTNPVEMVMLKVREMDRFIAAQRIMKEMRDAGLLQFVPVNKHSGPSGWVQIKDPTFTVRGKAADGSSTIEGHYWAPETSARVLNNYLSPGMRGNPIARGIMSFNNHLNQAQLGMSAFHLGFTSIDANTSRIALGIERMTEGVRSHDMAMATKGLWNVVSSPAAFITNGLVGKRLRQEWRSPGASGDPHLARMVQLMKESGAGVSLDPVYRTDMIKKVQETFRQGDGYMKLVWRAPLAVNEWFARPIMDGVVPMQKLGVFADLMSFEMERLEKRGLQMDTSMIRQAGTKAWDSVDNRMGMLRYDNLFWEKWIKDFAMMATRSVGWNLGTWRELGGGALDFRQNLSRFVKSKGKDWELTHRMAYWPAMIGQTMMVGGLLHWMYNQKAPEELRDWIFPKTGRKDEYGRDARISIPSYMKDVYHYSHNFSGAAAGKLHSSIWTVADMLQNRDFYNVEIANANDPMMKQVIDYTAFLAKQYTPFSWANISRLNSEGAKASELVLSEMGFIPAPSEVKKTTAENLATKIMAGQLPKRPIRSEEREHQLKRQDLERKIRMNENWKEFANREVEEGSLSQADVMHAIDRAAVLPLDRSVRHLRLQDVVSIYDKGNKQEKEMIRTVLRDRVEKNPRQLERLPNKEREKLAKEILDILQGVR